MRLLGGEANGGTRLGGEANGGTCAGTSRVDRAALAPPWQAPKSLAGGLEGTPYYLAPELFQNTLQKDNSMYSYASDVWALGVVMYELASLERPYVGDSLPSLAYRIVVSCTSHFARAL